MAQCSLRGVVINFPYTPYKLQEDYMDKVIQCLQMGVNGMLESPTGTGKTLSLLCSVLAWLEDKKAQQQLLVNNLSSNAGSEPILTDLRSQLDSVAGLWKSGPNIMVPQVIYSSRTHSQLSQAVQELKRSSYKHVKSVVLGSRDQLCIHPEVSKIQSNASKVYACRAKVASKSCPFYLNYEEKILSQKEYVDSTVFDIEDLVSSGKKTICCPYYAARSLRSKADIVFAPYNYVIDPKTRRAQGIELSNNVVIFDEAHNIESVCEESMSFQLRSLDLAMCINEVTQTMELIKDSESKDLTCSDSGVPDFTMHDLAVLKVMFCELEELLDKAVAESPDNGASKPGDYMIGILAKVEILPRRRDMILDVLDKIILYHSTNINTPFSTKGAGLQKFSDIIKVLFSRTTENDRSFDLNKEFAHKYRMYLQYETPKSQNSSDPWSKPTSASKKSWRLDCWCFSAGIGMQDLVGQGTHSILLTSGTLSPLPQLICELGIEFPVQLENPHIIGDGQVFVGILTNGPDNTALSSSYNNRFSEKYISSLGRTISNFCKVIPDGVLIFFPSYSLLKGNVSHWEENGIWQNLSAIKPLFLEPQRRDALQESIEQFYDRINDPQSRGAALLAVCRGKVSEGLDFADKNARAVIITGLPYPPFMDARVKLKMAYLDACAKEKKGLTGQEWYVLQATRAVNQAIGRVIRHKDDYGAILLCDNRFGENRLRNQLSKWVRNHIRVFNSFGPAIKQLTVFYKSLEKNPIKPVPTLGGFVSSPSTSRCAINKVPAASVNQPGTSKRTEENIFDIYAKPESCNENESRFQAGSSSVFDALDACEHSSSTIASRNKSFPLPTKNARNESSADSSGKQFKKRKINITFRQAYEHEQGGDNNKKEAKKEVCMKFLVEVKSILCSSGLYGKFCSAVKEYRDSKNTIKFAKEMGDVFREVPERQKYLQRTSSLVSHPDRNLFLTLSEQHAGSS